MATDIVIDTRWLNPKESLVLPTIKLIAIAAHQRALLGFTGSHNELSEIQGGAVNDYYHLSLAQHNNLTNGDEVQDSLKLNDLSGSYHRSVAVDASGSLHDEAFWDDLVVSATLVNLAGTPSPPTYNDAEMTLDFSATSVNTIQLAYQMPHAWMVGQSDVNFHVHWFPSSTNTGNVVWELKYRWTNINDVVGAYTTVTTTEAAPGVIKQQKIGASFTLDGTGKGISSILQMQLQRLGTDAADTFTGLAQVMSLDCHYKRDSYGSIQEYIKS